MPQVSAAIALGSNVGDRHAHLEAAFGALAHLPRSRLIGRSTIHETEPVGPVPQRAYLNAAALLDTGLTPHELLDHLFTIERSRGRERTREIRWGPRTLDLDLLLYGDLVLQEPGLTVPHPRLHERLFVLEPLAELCPDAAVPGVAGASGRTVRQWRDALRDSLARMQNRPDCGIPRA